MSNSGEKLSRRQQLKTRLLDDMKVTTFYKPQSKSLKKCLIIRKMLEYHLIKIQGKKQLQ